MSKESEKEYKLPSMLEMSEVFDKLKRQTNPLFYHLERSNSIMGIASQYEHFNSAGSIIEIARKTLEQQNSASDNAIALRASANILQSQVPESVALQDSFYKIVKGLGLNKNSNLIAKNTMKGIFINDLYKDTVSSIDRLRESLEPLKDSISIAGKAFNGSEFANLVGEMQTSRVIPESTFSEFAGIVDQLESLSSLDSFRSLSKIKNLPIDTELNESSDTNFERLQATLAEAKRLDARISIEVSNTDDFNELSEETQRDSSLFLKNYRWLVMNLVVSLCLIEDYLDEDLDLSMKSFTIADNVEEVVINIGDYWNGNKVALFNSFIITQLNKLISFIVS